MRRACGVAVAAVCCLVLAGRAAEPVDILDTWTDPGTGLWTHEATDVSVNNPGGYLNLGFALQTAPAFTADTVWRSVDTGVLLTNLSFSFCPFNLTPSRLQLCLRATTGSTWYLALPEPVRGTWKTITAAVNYDAGWTMGPASTRERFAQDVRSVASVGVYVRRHGDIITQNYGIDNFRQQGELLPAADPYSLDSDGDGMPDYWEDRYTLNAHDPTDAPLDKDGDGSGNYEEYVAGTDPSDPASRLAIVSVEGIGTNSYRVVYSGETGLPYTEELRGVERVVIWWTSESNRIYSVYQAPDVFSAYVPLAVGLPATPPLNVYTAEPDTVMMRFYRIGVRMGP